MALLQFCESMSLMTKISETSGIQLNVLSLTPPRYTPDKMKMWPVYEMSNVRPTMCPAAILYTDNHDNVTSIKLHSSRIEVLHRWF